jgi:hypothetical protein
MLILLLSLWGTLPLLLGVLFPFRRVVRIVMSGLPPLPRISLRRFARSESPRLVNGRLQLRVIGEVVALVAC